MTDEFYANYVRTANLPHGFVNTYADKVHLNKHGHQMIAERLLKTFGDNHEEYH